MKSLLFVILLTASTTFAATNVNISFTQQHSSLVPKYVEAHNQQVQLKSSESGGQFNTDEQNVRFARIQLDDNKKDSNLKQDVSVSEMKNSYESATDYRSEQVPSEKRAGYVSSTQPQNHGKRLYIANYEDLQNTDHLKNLSPQDKQNMEFERYIQNYHSGPTVETVYETAKPGGKHTLQTSTVNEGPQRVVSINHRSSNVAKFERQIALPSKMDNVQTTSDHKTVQIQESSPLPLPSTASSYSSSSSLSSPASVPNESSTSGNSFKVNIDQKSNPVGQEGVTYNKPNYNDPAFKYNEGRHFDSHFYNQFPPSAEEPQSGYGEYYGNVHNRQQVTDGYHPVGQRPVVTKTIQIAQPAIKAKKYEVRHPAIQKEFYDIEERVVIKPAGTVVVELERPSAKILKEETTLPLGHPHPAVAAAYMSNKQNPTFSNVIYSNAGSSSSANRVNNQYIPQQVYSNKNVDDQRSHSYDQNSKDVTVDSNANKQYIAFNSNTPKSQHREIVVLTDSQGNQRQVSIDQFAYSRDEADKTPSRTVYNQRSSFTYNDNGRVNSQSNATPQRSDNREEFALDTEYINNSGNANYRTESKPARLQEISSKVSEKQHQPQPIIKHEHKIVLSPSQHNIYLSHNQEVPKMKVIEEPAQFREISPYLQNHRGPVVVYASTKTNSEMPYSQRSEYHPKARVSSQVVQFRESPRILHSNIAENQVKYSAPYAQMRRHPDRESAVQELQYQRQENVAVQRKSENLIVEERSGMSINKTNEESVVNKQAPQAHIQIKIPNQSSHEADKAIVVSSTIRPMMMDDNSNQMHNSKLEISVTNNGEPHEYHHGSSEQKDTNIDNGNDNSKGNNNKTNDENESDTELLANLKTESDCGKKSPSVESENYRDQSNYHKYRQQQKFMRIVEGSGATSSFSTNDASSSIETPVNQPHNVDVNVKSSVGNVNQPGSRVIAATPAPKEATPSESFHKRRIVVNHPFQTVREVVEHEPYTNYHEVQVKEPATPALYNSANYFKSY